MIEVKNLSKSYGSKLAVDGISFPAGESVSGALFLFKTQHFQLHEEKM